MSTVATLRVEDRPATPTQITLSLPTFDPRTWVTGFVSVAVWVSASDRLIPLACACGILLAVLLLTQWNGQRPSGGVNTRSMIVWALVAAAITIVLYAVFGPERGSRVINVSGLAIKIEALRLGLVMALRLIALLLSSAVLLANVPPLRLATGLTRLLMPLRHLGVPVPSFFYLAFFLTRMIPNLIMETRMIAMAQRSRGVAIKKWKSAPALVLPLFASSLRRSDNAALVLASRGFDPRRIPAGVRELRLATADYVALIALLCGWGLWLYLQFA